MAVTKVINSESKQYKPVLTDMLVLDAVPTVNSLNGVTSDAVARAISGASGEVPQVTESDNGKVLTAVYDEGGAAVEWAEAQGGNVDQTYDATSTNAQSGVAVAQAIAAIPSEVSTASGHFDLEGSVPVTVNYTGTPHVVSDYITLTNPTSITFGTSGLGIIFPTQGNKDLGSDTANLVISETIHAKLLGVFYSMDVNPSPGPSITTSTGSITSGTIEPQTIVLSGSNPAASFGFGNDILLQVSDLTDGETMETILTKVSIQHWPAQTVDGYETTIPVVDQNYHSESANAQSGVAVAQAIAAIPSASYTAGNGIDISAQNAISVETTVETDTDHIDFGGTDPVKVEFTRKTRSSSETQAADAVAASTTYQNAIYFDLDAFDSAVGSGFEPKFQVKKKIWLDSYEFAYIGFTDTIPGSSPSTTGFIKLGDDSYMSISAQTIDLLSSFPTIATQRPGRYFALIVPSTRFNESDVAANPGDYAALTGWPKSVTVTEEYTDIPNIPASTSADENKVLTVNSSGNAVWATAALGTVQSIQQVNALPASPDANTLYLIPET